MTQEDRDKNVPRPVEELDRFRRYKSGTDCPMCLSIAPGSAENLNANIVVTLSSGNVHLQDDADYRGYCILILHRHAVEIHELSADERTQWIEDMARIGSAITAVCQPVKLNYSMLGNMVPHLHCHIMPRYFSDPEWGGPPAFRASAVRQKLASDEFERMKLALAEELISRV